MVALVHLVLVFGFAQLACAEEDYEGYKLVELSLPSPDKLHELIDDYRDQIDEFGHSDNSVTVMIPPEHIQPLKELIVRSGGTVKVIHHNMQEAADADFRELQRVKRATPDLEQDIKTFMNLEQNYDFQQRMMEEFPQITRTEIGRSHEDNPIYVLRISANPNGPRKRTIFFDAGIHAREWLAPATANYILYQLVNDNKNLLEEFDFEILPVLNPDGYKHTHSSSSARYWRKNRQPNPGSCMGTDLNRNFGYPRHMPGSGGSTNPCSNVYSGPTAFSAPETRALGGHLDAHNDTIVSYISLHTYGRYILYSWGYSRTAALDGQADIHDLAVVGRNAIKSASPLVQWYKIGSASTALYVAAGISADYACGGAGIKYSYTYELPPNTFSPHPNYTPTYQKEVFPGILAMIEALANLTSIISDVPNTPTTPEPTTFVPTTPEPTTFVPTTPEPTTFVPTTSQPVTTTYVYKHPLLALIQRRYPLRLPLYLAYFRQRNIVPY